MYSDVSKLKNQKPDASSSGGGTEFAPDFMKAVNKANSKNGDDDDELTETERLQLDVLKLQEKAAHHEGRFDVLDDHLEFCTGTTNTILTNDSGITGVTKGLKVEDITPVLPDNTNNNKK